MRKNIQRKVYSSKNSLLQFLLVRLKSPQILCRGGGTIPLADDILDETLDILALCVDEQKYYVQPSNMTFQIISV